MGAETTMSQLDRFLSQQDAFFESVASSRTQVIKRAAWESRGAFYLRGTRIKATQMVQVDTDVQRMAFNFVKDAYPRIADAFNEFFVPVAVSAFRDWPVKTGLSKSLLALEFDNSGDQFTGSIVNRAPYAVFINNNDRSRVPSQNYKGLVFEPGEKAAEQMAEAIADILGG
jgi:hypothetical protein